jgi:hypothetical protein
LRCWPRPARSLSLDKPYAGEFIAVAKLQALDLVQTISGAHRAWSCLAASKAALHQTLVRSMTSLAGSYSALVASMLASLARFAAESALKLCKHVSAAMQRSSERQAARVIARYRHLAADHSAGVMSPEQTSQRS